MLNVNKADIDLLKSILPNVDIEKTVNGNSVNALLDPLNEYIGFEGIIKTKNDDYEYTELGEKAQKVYDRIYADNQ